MKRLFNPELVYPSDQEGGRYVELDGTIVEVGTIDVGTGDLREISVAVKTDDGDVYTGFARYPRRPDAFEPQVGYVATIRIYDAGGGWYPDNRIMRYSKAPAAPFSANDFVVAR